MLEFTIGRQTRIIATGKRWERSEQPSLHPPAKAMTWIIRGEFYRSRTDASIAEPDRSPRDHRIAEPGRSQSLVTPSSSCTASMTF